MGEGGAEGVDGGGVDEGVDGAAEDGGFADSGEAAELGEEGGDGGRWGFEGLGFEFEAGGVGWVGVGELLQVGDRAEGDEFGHVDVAEAAAALGFVHVVGGDEEGDALAGELEEEVPEGAAGDGVDAGGGLVEEDDLGGVDDGAGQGEALLPASGELGDAAGEVGVEAGEVEEFGDAGPMAVG